MVKEWYFLVQKKKKWQAYFNATVNCNHDIWYCSALSEYNSSVLGEECPLQCGTL